MIAKAKSCVGGTALFAYVVNEKKGYELEINNLSGEKSSELYRSMQVIQNQNLRCKNNTISIVLSPEIEDGNKLSDDDWKQLSHKLMSDLGIDIVQAQYISFIHTEKTHKHLHIILNRVKDDGSLIKDNFISKRSQHIAHRAAKEMGLKSARDIKQQNEKNSKAVLKEFREDFRNAHESVSNLFPKNIKEYISRMLYKGFIIKETVNKQGNVQGYRIDELSSGISLKLSEVDRKLKLNEAYFNLLAYRKHLAEESKRERSTIKPSIKQEDIKPIYNDIEVDDNKTNPDVCEITPIHKESTPKTNTVYEQNKVKEKVKPKFRR